MEHQKRAIKLYKTGDYLGADAEYDQALAVLGPTLELLDGKAAVFERRGDWKSGLEWAQKCVDAFGEQPEGYLRASRIYESRHKWQQAATMMEQAIERAHPAKQRSLRKMLDGLRRPEEPEAMDPVKRLPAELWAQVMAILVEYNPEGAIPISHVSKAWRNATLACPTAWSSLRAKHGDRRIPGKIQAWLKRSKGRIDRIDLDMVKDEAIASLAESVRHARKVRLRGDEKPYTKSWVGRLLRVEELDLQVWAEDGHPLRRPLCAHLLDPLARSLHTLARRSCFGLLDMSNAQASSLRHLYINGDVHGKREVVIDPADSSNLQILSPLHALLAGTPHLKTCWFTGDFLRYKDFAQDSGALAAADLPIAPINLSELTSWSVMRAQAKNRRLQLLPVPFALPAVSSLAVKLSWEGWMTMQAIASVNIVASNLRQLYVTRQNYKSGFKAIDLAALTGLEDLTLDLAEDDTKFFFKQLLEKPCILPKLQRLDISLACQKPGPLIALVTARNGTVVIDTKTIQDSPHIARQIGPTEYARCEHNYHIDCHRLNGTPEGGINTVAGCARIHTLILREVPAAFQSSDLEWLDRHVPRFAFVRTVKEW